MIAPHWWPAYIGVGSNMASPKDQVTRAIAAMQEIPKTSVPLRSPLYRSAPLGPVDQPDFVNAVAALLTQLDAERLLVELKAIEARHGRSAGAERWGPRTLDLDLLAYDGLELQTEDLTLPHPRIIERNFVMLPWNDIAPHFHVPGYSTVAELARRVPADNPRIERIG
jgi:2-amino-4-hydroxy-6-hydroxymethyldihydropteridine diphosphokinase